MSRATRPMTQRERMKAKSDDGKYVTVHNPTNHVVHLQIDNGGDFFVGQQTIRIGPHKSYKNKSSVFDHNQLVNLRTKGMVKVSTNG